MTDPNEWTDDVAGTPEDRPVPTGGRAERGVPARTHAAVPDALLEVDDVTLRFGGVVQPEARGDLRPHRPEWRR